MGTILEKKVGVISILSMNRPPVLNALNSAMYRELSESLQRIAEDRSVKVVILTGEGSRAFSVGADIKEMYSLDVEGGRQFSELSQQPGHLLATIPQVTIAAINGYAMGGGFELALACDLCVASDDACFALPETGLGIIPSGGGTQRLSRIVGSRWARYLILTGCTIDSSWAKKLGIVNQIVAKDQLLNYCLALGEKLSSRSGNALGLAKRAIAASQDMDINNGCTQESVLQGLAFASHEKEEGMKAYLEKRTPNFGGH